jgi:hypothetical protein
MVALSHKNQKFFMIEVLMEKKIFRQLLHLRWVFPKDMMGIAAELKTSPEEKLIQHENLQHDFLSCHAAIISQPTV